MVNPTIVYLLASVTNLVATTPTLFGLTPTLFWLVLGGGLCLLELFLPTAFTAFTMGLSALAVALLSSVVTSPQWQVGLWLLLSSTLIFLSRRFLPKRKVSSIQDATEAQTITEIPAGETGRVLYEGNSWRARCADEKLALSPNQKVYVVSREGTTLIIMPDNLADY